MKPGYEMLIMIFSIAIVSLIILFFMGVQNEELFFPPEEERTYGSDNLTNVLHRLDDVEEYILEERCRKDGGNPFRVERVTGIGDMRCTNDKQIFKPYGLEWVKMRDI
jgi:hypothetical protein